MTYSAKVYWDEENSPVAFCWLWAVAQLLLIVEGLSLKFGGMHPAVPPWLNIISLLAALAAATTYCNLVINCIWHKTEWAEQGDKESVESLDMSLVRFKDESAQSTESDDSPMFRTNLEGDPIETRDEIQW